MINSSIANYALSKINFQVLNRVVNNSPLANVVYKHISQRLIDLKFPVHVFIEATNTCNLRCIMCPREENESKLGSMDYGLFKKIVDESSLYGKRNFCLHLWGEPLLAHNILGMMEYIKRKNSKNAILLTTNGVPLSKDKIDGILKCGVDKITISLLASDANIYSRITGRDQYEVVVDNINKLVSRKRERNLHKPIIFVRILSNEKMVDHIETFREQWKSSGVVVDIRKEHNYGGGNQNPCIRDNEMQSRYPCYHLWFSPAISWDGDMSICCDDWNRSAVIGNVKDSTISELWQSSELTEYRRLHLAGEYNQIELCKECDVWKIYPDLFFKSQKIALQ